MVETQIIASKMTREKNISIPFSDGNVIIVIRGDDHPYVHICSFPKVSFPGDTECGLVSFSEVEEFIDGVKSKSNKEVKNKEVKNLDVILISERVTKNKVDHMKSNFEGVSVTTYEYEDILFPFTDYSINGEKRIMMMYDHNSGIISLSGSANKKMDIKSIHNYVSGNWFEETQPNSVYLAR